MNVERLNRLREVMSNAFFDHESDRWVVPIEGDGMSLFDMNEWFKDGDMFTCNTSACALGSYALQDDTDMCIEPDGTFDMYVVRPVGTARFKKPAGKTSFDYAAEHFDINRLQGDYLFDPSMYPGETDTPPEVIRRIDRLLAGKPVPNESLLEEYDHNIEDAEIALEEELQGLL